MICLMKQTPPYKRILLKLSGELMKGSLATGIEATAAKELALALRTLLETGTQVGLVLGGGNIFRGVQGNALGMDRARADQMGMLATLMNGIALEEACLSIGCPCLLMSALECPRVAESFQLGKARKALDEGLLVIFVGGTGNPFFTTDTGAALRASEIGAEVLIKGTKVDGVYACDPKIHPDAQFYENLSYEQVLSQRLEIMDSTAIALCRQNKIPVYVFNMKYITQKEIGKLLTLECGGSLIN